MKDHSLLDYIKAVLENMPTGWLSITTHRLDIYEEQLAKTQFLTAFEALYSENKADATALDALPTAYDYIRLGHPLSCVLEWVLARMHQLPAQNVISFSSRMMPVLAILRKNQLEGKTTQIVYTEGLPPSFDAALLEQVYGYTFELRQVDTVEDISEFNGSTIFISSQDELSAVHLRAERVDFYVHLQAGLGSIIYVLGSQNAPYVAEIQHVRRRESIAMTPASCLIALQLLIDPNFLVEQKTNMAADKASVEAAISSITEAHTKALMGSSGLSIQYAIMMGLIHDAIENHPGKAIKFVVPPNCYGGTNDQARRVAASIAHVEVVDLPVDGGNDMVESLDIVLEKIAKEDAIPYIIAEIPTNPRVEVPDLDQLQAVLSKQRSTATGQRAIESVFILDQTFCPNAHFLGASAVLASGRAISYASGSKFPSGGLCTAGYCVGNKKTVSLMEKIELHLRLCDNEATALQMEILATQLPSMNQRIKDAYANTRAFVRFIEEVLPTAKINFVPDELAEKGFTPSVFSLDLPTKGNSEAEREAHKRALNHRLIHMMITEIPNESKFCVSYGQLKGCYWTIPATSTQGTTKEGDKDYIVRASLSPNMDLALHKKVFLDFVNGI